MTVNEMSKNLGMGVTHCINGLSYSLRPGKLVVEQVTLLVIRIRKSRG